MPSNRILSRLSRRDFALLEPHLEAVDLPVRKPLETRRRRIDQVYFIESGFASVVANGTDKPSIEVGIHPGVGRGVLRDASCEDNVGTSTSFRSSRIKSYTFGNVGRFLRPRTFLGTESN